MCENVTGSWHETGQQLAGLEVVWTLCGGEEGLVVSDGGCVDIVWW